MKKTSNKQAVNPDTFPKCFGLADKRSGNAVQAYHCGLLADSGLCNREIKNRCQGVFGITWGKYGDQEDAF